MVLDTGLATKSAIIFCTWILYFRKNKMKANFGCETNSFLAGNTATAGQNCFFVNCRYKTYEILRKQRFFREQIRSKPSARTPRLPPFLRYMVYIFPMSYFLSKCPAGKKIRWNFYENQTQKQIFGGNCCENRTKIKHKKQNFWRKMLRKSYFLKKKHFLIFARFS